MPSDKGYFVSRYKSYLLPEWKEIDFGRFEGKNYQDLNGDPDYQRWIDSGGVTAFPGGESRDEFVKRSMAGLEWCIECMEDYKPKKCSLYCSRRHDHGYNEQSYRR